MGDTRLTLKITGRLAYEDEITIVQATQIIEFLNSDSVTSLGSDGTTRRHSPAGETVRVQASAPRAALDDSGAQTNPQKILALADWVVRDGGETFQLDAVKVEFQRAREPMPKNISRDLGTAIAAGWVAEAETKGEFYVTNTGYEALENGFGSDSPIRAPRKVKARGGSNGGPKSGASARGAKPAGLASIDVFSPVMSGVDPYHRMPTQKDKLLWALHFAQENGVKGITNTEAAWLTNELGDGISSKHLTARFDLLRKTNYANRSTTDRKMRITPDGVTFLQSIKPKKA
jgi:hypothetical protein